MFSSASLIARHRRVLYTTVKPFTSQQVARRYIRRVYSQIDTPLLVTPLPKSSLLRYYTTAHQPSISDTSSVKIVKDNTFEKKSGPLLAYQTQIDAGIVRNDTFQRTIVEQLQELHDELLGYYENLQAMREKTSTTNTSKTGLFSKVCKKMNMEFY
jgi:hypothetical protein